MSILYDYLKILEKKGARESESPKAPIGPKKSLNVWFYLAAGLALLLIKQAVTEKAGNSQQILNSVSQDTAAINSNNADFSLKGIIYNAESPSAIINGMLVEKNARIGGWQVIDISSSEVKLKNTNNESVLTLKLLSSSGQ